MTELDPILIRTCLDSDTPLSDETVRAVVEEWLAQPPMAALEALIARLVAEEREACALVLEQFADDADIYDSVRMKDRAELGRLMAGMLRARHVTAELSGAVP
jgi:hypothetical protein